MDQIEDSSFQISNITLENRDIGESGLLDFLLERALVLREANDGV